MRRFEGYSLEDFVGLSAVGWVEVLDAQTMLDPGPKHRQLLTTRSKIFDLLSQELLRRWALHSCRKHDPTMLMAITVSLTPGSLDEHFQTLDQLPNKFGLGLAFGDQKKRARERAADPNGQNSQLAYTAREKLSRIWLDRFYSVAETVVDQDSEAAEDVFGDTVLYELWKTYLERLG